jgi:hypothetical protein
MLKAIEFNITLGWDKWIDEYGYWFNPNKPNPNQLELFE